MNIKEKEAESGCNPLLSKERSEEGMGRNV
jgi:hypothetical protein